jgi:hypothetical protein
MTPEQVKEVIQLQKEIDELEEMRECGVRLLVKNILSGRYTEFRSGWFSKTHEVPSYLNKRIQEVIVDEIEARKIMLADLGEEE